MVILSKEGFDRGVKKGEILEIKGCGTTLTILGAFRGGCVEIVCLL